MIKLIERVWEVHVVPGRLGGGGVESMQGGKWGHGVVRERLADSTPKPNWDGPLHLGREIAGWDLGRGHLGWVLGNHLG